MTDALLEGAWILAAIWAAAVAFVALGATWLRWRLGRRSRPAPRVAAPRVRLVRPCAGDEPGLADRLASVAYSRFTGELDVVLSAARANDPALPAMRQARRRLIAAGIACRVTIVAPRGPNRKASMLAAVGDHDVDVIVNADSDVDLTGFGMDTLTATLAADEPLGALWCPPTEETPPGDLGARVSEAVLAGSLHAFGLLCAIDPAGLVGKVFAVRTSALRDVGGFSPLSEYLGEDMELSRRLRRAGWAVQPLPLPVRAVGGRRQLADTIARHARWMSVIRAQRPALLLTYPLLFCGTPAQLALAAVGALANPAAAGLTAAAAVAARLVVAASARYFSRRPAGPVTWLVDAVLGDVVLLVALGRCVGSRRLQWRGNALRIRADGRLEAA